MKRIYYVENWKSVTILVAILCFALAACVESQPISTAPLSKPTVYEWIGPGPQPSVTSMAHDKAACAQEAEQEEFVTAGDRWQTHVNLCMRTKGWGQKAID
jgi:hypothetical protein